MIADGSALDIYTVHDSHVLADWSTVGALTHVNQCSALILALTIQCTALIHIWVPEPIHRRGQDSHLIVEWSGLDALVLGTVPLDRAARSLFTEEDLLEIL